MHARLALVVKESDDAKKASAAATATPMRLNIRAGKAALVQLNWVRKSINSMEEALVVHSLFHEDSLSQIEIAILLGRHKKSGLSAESPDRSVVNEEVAYLPPTFSSLRLLQIIPLFLTIFFDKAYTIIDLCSRGIYRVASASSKLAKLAKCWQENKG